MSNITLTKVFGGSLTVDAEAITRVSYGVNDQSVKVTYTNGASAAVVGTLASVKTAIEGGSGVVTSVNSAYVDSYATVTAN